MAVLNNIDSQNCVNYFESYIDCIDNMALEFQKLISSLKEIFINYKSIHNELSKIMHIFIHAKIKKQHCKKMKFRLTRIMFEAQDYQSSRLEIIQCMFEMMENKSRQMEQVYKLTGVERPQMDLSKSETVVKENNISSEREQRQSKRAKRASNKLDENDLALGNSEHSIKIDNNGSINSSVMSKMSSAQAAAKKAAAAKKKKRKTTNRQNQMQKDDDSTKPIIDSSIDPDEPTYCLCDQISYGEMICCDNDSCPIEWFHFDCVSLSTKPKGKWFCPNCRGDRPNVMKPKAVLLKELEKYRKK